MGENYNPVIFTLHSHASIYISTIITNNRKSFHATNIQINNKTKIKISNIPKKKLLIVMLFINTMIIRSITKFIIEIFFD